MNCIIWIFVVSLALITTVILYGALIAASKDDDHNDRD